MPVQVRFELNRRGVGQVAKGDDLRAELLRRAKRVEADAHGKVDADDQRFIEATGHTGKNRARASVMWRGGLDKEIADRVLGQAIDAARG